MRKKILLLLIPVLMYSQENNSSLIFNGDGDYIYSGTNATNSPYNATWMGWFYFDNLTTPHTSFFTIHGLCK